MNNNNSYELHTYEDPTFPFIFHYDTMEPNHKDFLPHWHENIEMLCVVEGAITVMSDANVVTAYKDDIVVINSNNVHHIETKEEGSKYYCLIVNSKFCEENQLNIEEITLERLITDQNAINRYNSIKEEFENKNILYKSAIKSLTMELLIYLYRNYSLSESTLSNKSKSDKIEIIKNSIRFIQDNYHNAISVDDIAKNAGLSKYYFCHIFKEFTGITTVRYVNIMRCEKAKKLLHSGKYRVEEVAFLCGFENLSYFSKTYKKYMGCLPSRSKGHVMKEQETS